MGFHFLIDFLKLFNEFTCFISKGTVFHITEPKYIRVLFPNNSVLTLGILKYAWDRNWELDCFFVNSSATVSVDKLFTTL